MRRQIGLVLAGVALVLFAALAALEFLTSDTPLRVLLALVFGLLIPASVAWEWWSATKAGDSARVSAIERMVPIVALALAGVSLLGK